MRPVHFLVLQDQQSGRWGWVLLVPAGFAAFLGCWQVNRYSWKVDLLERRASGLKVCYKPFISNTQLWQQSLR